MQRATRRNLLLLIVIAVLALLIAAQLRSERELAADRILRPAATPVTSIAIDCQQCQARSFELIDGYWWMRSPYALPADDEAIDRLLAIGRQPVRWRDAGDALALAALGLQPPLARLQLDGLEISFGHTEAIDGLRYVQVDDRIGRVADHLSLRLQVPPLAELDHQLVPPAMTVVGVRIGQAQEAGPQALWANLRATQVIAHTDSKVASHFDITLHFDGHDSVQLALDAERDIVWREQPPVGYLVSGHDMAQLRAAYAAAGD